MNKTGVEYVNNFGINWVWYLSFQFVDKEKKTVKLLEHFRVHKYEGDEHPYVTMLGDYDLIATKEGIVLGFTLGKQQFEAVNPCLDSDLRLGKQAV